MGVTAESAPPAHPLASHPIDQVPKRRRRPRQAHMPSQDMNKFVPIIALAVAGLGWCWAALVNRQLRRRVRQLEEEAKAHK